MLQNGDKVGIVACSNPQRKESRIQMKQLEHVLQDMGLVPVWGDCIYEKESNASGMAVREAASAKERARVLMDFYQDETIKAIFDVSGGDLANGILPHLDYDRIAKESTVFWGYSDLTTLVNAIYTKTGKASVLYQVRNLISCEHGAKQKSDFEQTIMRAQNPQRAAVPLFQADYEIRQGKELKGVVIGGNIRCFLKLAGTPYMPDLEGKVLLLEARSGLGAQIETYFAQLAQMGAFEKVAGVLLGTFSQLESENEMVRPEDLLKKYAGEDLPIAVTKQIGHGTDSKAIWIGKELI